MADYTKHYTQPYTDGYKNDDGATPVTAEIKNMENDTFKALEKFAKDLELPTKLSDLEEDTEHMTVTSLEKLIWNQGSYELPPATKTKLGGIKVGANLTVTEDGTLNATGGGGGGAVDSVNGQTGDVVLKLSDLNGDSTHRTVTDAEKSTWNGKGDYSKPASGIPKSDLASSVQTSLGKADSALQSYTETDPTVPSHVKSIMQAEIDEWNGNAEDISELQSKVVDFVVEDSTLHVKGALLRAGGGVMLDYSYEEQATGIKWVDGKMIYQRTFRLVENNQLKYPYANNIFTVADLDVCESFIASELVNQREEGINSWWDNHTSNNNGDRLVLVPKRGAVFLMYYGINLRNTWVTFQYTKIGE